MMFEGQCLNRCYTCDMGHCFNNGIGELTYCVNCTDILVGDICNNCPEGYIMFENKCFKSCDTVDCLNGVCGYNNTAKDDFFCASCYKNSTVIINATSKAN